MNKKLNQMSSQELEELQIKISKELNNRQLSTKNGELEKIKQKFIGKYIKYATGSSTYVGYVKDITVGYIKDTTTVSNRYTLICTGFAIDTYTYNDISLSVNPCYYIYCNTEKIAKIQCITKDEMKEIFKECIGKLNECFGDKVLNDDDLVYNSL